VERGQIAFEPMPTTVFVFDGLIAHLEHPRVEKTALKLRQFAAALDAWVLDYRVCDYISRLITQFNTPVDVLTWRPSKFAHLLQDRLWEQDVYVDEVKSTVYEHISQQIAIDTKITMVYDPDPMHRFGYGFKAREFDVGTY
jgi:hypothetical protein